MKSLIKKNHLIEAKVKIVLHFKALSFIALLSSCASVNPNNEKHGVPLSQAGPAKYGKTHEQLISLPEPAGAIYVAVYEFSDHTGQNKPAPASGFSKMVTQGGQFYMTKALLDSGWFLPVARSGLKNLLTERKLWSQNTSAPNYQRPEPIALGSVIIEGGIIGYDTNIRTGGAGARYLGIGRSTKYREDSIVINLSLINPVNGLIIHSITSSKLVYSNSVDTNLFGFVTHNKILELEAGYAQNEPLQASIVEAIESALINLIVEGVKKKTWALKNPLDIRSPIFSRFLNESEIEEFLASQSSTTALTKSHYQDSTSIGIGVNAEVTSTNRDQL